MAKHTQTIRRQFADELFECVWSFCEIRALGVKSAFALHAILKVYTVSLETKLV